MFDHELDALLYRSMFASGAESRALGSEAAIAAAEDVLPARLRVAWLSWPNDARDVFRAYGGPSDDRFDRLVTIDPATGEVLGSGAGEGGLPRFIYDPHFRLQLDASGQTVVGIVGVLMLLSVGSGLYPWWPRKRADGAQRGAPPAMGFRSASRDRDLRRCPAAGDERDWHLHGAAGYTEPAVDLFSPITPRIGTIASNGARDAADIDVDTAVEIARNRLPGATVTGVGLPRREAGTYRVALSEPAHPRDSDGRSYVRVDRHTGEVHATRT